jgi:hypothetical protein
MYADEFAGGGEIRSSTASIGVEDRDWKLYACGLLVSSTLLVLADFASMQEAE